MTLLSIREQEAVQAAYRAWRRHKAGSAGDAFGHDDYDRAIILATRDAIARMVRERDLGAKIANDDTATFIEGLGVDR